MVRAMIGEQQQKRKKEDAMNEVYEFLKACGTYYLATLEGDQPHVRPFGTVAIFEGSLYIQTGKSKEVSKQIQANPKVIDAYLGVAEDE